MTRAFSQLKEDIQEPLSMVEFAVLLEKRLDDKLHGLTIDPRISDLALCNLDRRADITTIHVINEILTKRENADMLLHIALMRAGPNNPNNYTRFIEVINNDFSLESLRESIPNYEAGWTK
eukprot:SAG11_NODE_23873_length_381_cov_194.833333_1_plen_120_part_10